MFTATTARSQTVSNSISETEIALINLNIISAVTAGNVTATITKTTQTTLNGNVIIGSPMTLDQDYYTAWQTSVSNAYATGLMQTVLDNFARLGYTISRTSTDGQHINWQISW
jgi:dUTPase